MLDQLNPWDAREEQFEVVTERAIRNGGYGTTEAGQALINRYLKTTAEAVIETKSRDCSNQPKVQRLLEIVSGLDPELVALCALNAGINAVAADDALTPALLRIGRDLEAEVWAQGWYEFDERAAEVAQKSLKRRHGSIKHRRQAARSLASKAGYKARKWTKDELLIAGNVLIEVLVAGGAFTLDDIMDEHGNDTFRLAMAAEAHEHAVSFVQMLLDKYPVHQPLLKAPKPWKGITRSLEYDGRSYTVQLVRKDCKVTQGILRDTIRSGKMDGVLEAINGIEQTAWSINTPILELLEWAKENNLTAEGKVLIEGLPPQTDLPEPPRALPWDDMDEDQRKAWRIATAKVKETNRAFAGQRGTLDRDIATATALKDRGNKFWTPCNVDYRGRVYYLPQFNFQRQDYVRAMFQFSKGEPLGERGLFWLKVHIATCGAFDKVDKKPFEDRARWFDKHIEDILAVGAAPRSMVDWWSKADAPFMFVAACMEYAAAVDHGDLEAYVCHLPVNFDGSCSGLQHLAAMTLCDRTAPLVNVRPTEAPADIYQTVWDAVLPKFQWDMEHSLNQEDREMAAKVLAFGGGRSLVKRNVMVYSYGSKQYGMADQHQEDLMKPLALKVLMKEYGEHPFLMPSDTKTTKDGREYTVPGTSIAKYLAKHIFQTIEETVTRPAEAMSYLQKIAKTMAHEGKPVIWHTPLGFPVVLRCPNVDRKRVRLYMYDRGVRSTLNAMLAVDGNGIDKAKAANTIAPSFVHSLDACHLMMVVNASKREGIHNVALVHDSFGCLPSQADRFRDILVEQFYWLYAQHDVLNDIRDEAFEQIQTNGHRLPEALEKGSLNIEEVLNARYAFA